MNIAIIEDNQDYIDLLKLYLKDSKWITEFFLTSEDFGKAHLKKYDVIIADYVLPNSVDGRKLLEGIHSKTSAELFLMSAYPENFIKSDIDNGNINGFIDKISAQNVIDTLKYCDSKIRINKLVKSETEKFDYIVSNGFDMEIQDGSAIIKINEVLSENSKQKIMEKVSSNEIKKAIVAYPKSNLLKSTDLSVIISLFNLFKIRKIKMIIWNINKNDEIANQLSICRIDTIIPIFDTLEKCLSI